MPGMVWGPLLNPELPPMRAPLPAQAPQRGPVGVVFRPAWGVAPQAGNIFGNAWGNQGQRQVQQLPQQRRPPQRRRPQQQYGGGGGVNWISQNPLLGFFQRIGWGG